MIISIMGTMCAGKTHTREQVEKIMKKQISTFDLLEFYNKHDCFDKHHNMIWQNWHKAVDLLPNAINKFIKENKICIIEHSFNSIINQLLANQEDVHEIILDIPELHKLANRAEKRKLPYKTVYDFYLRYKNNHHGSDLKTFSEEDAITKIISLLKQAEG